MIEKFSYVCLKSWRASGRDSTPAPGPNWESLNSPLDRQIHQSQSSGKSGSTSNRGGVTQQHLASGRPRWSYATGSSQFIDSYMNVSMLSNPSFFIEMLAQNMHQKRSNHYLNQSNVCFKYALKWMVTNSIFHMDVVAWKRNKMGMTFVSLQNCRSCLSVPQTLLEII